MSNELGIRAPKGWFPPLMEITLRSTQYVSKRDGPNLRVCTIPSLAFCRHCIVVLVAFPVSVALAVCEERRRRDQEREHD